MINVISIYCFIVIVRRYTFSWKKYQRNKRIIIKEQNLITKKGIRKTLLLKSE